TRLQGDWSSDVCSSDLTNIRVLARSVADSARLDSEHSPVKEADTRARLAAVLAELSAAVRAYGQLIEADPVPADPVGPSDPAARSEERRVGKEGELRAA